MADKSQAFLSVDSRTKLLARKKSAAVTGKLILIEAKHLAGNEQMNVRRSKNVS